MNCISCGGDHPLSQCAQLDKWLRIRFARKPGLTPGAIWATVWCCVVIVLIGSGLWRWL